MAKLFGTNAQVRPVQQTAIQPTGIPGSTFIRPQQREAGSNAMRLAEALGSMNGALQNFLNAEQAAKEDPNARANKEQVARLQQMNREQLAAEIKSGSLDGQRVQQDAAELLLAERANDDLRKIVAEGYNTEFDRSTGNFQEWFEGKRAEIAAGLPSEVSRGHLYRLSADFGRAWAEKDTEDKIAVVKQEIATTVVGGFRAAIDDAMRINGKTPEEAARIVFEKSAANRVFLRLSGQEQNDTVFLLAQEYANLGDEATARALLEGERVGDDGRALPALITIPAYSDKAYRLLDEAGAKADKDFRENDLPAQVTDDDLVARGAFTQAEADKRLGRPGYSAAGLSQMVATSQHNLQQIHQKAAQDLAKRERRRESEREENRVYAQAYGAMSRMGGINNIEDVEIASPTGEGTVRLSRQSIIDRAVSMKEDEFSAMQESLIKGGSSTEEARTITNRHRLDWYAGNRLENETWKNTLNGIAGRASADTLLQKGEVTEYLRDSAKLYRDLKATNSPYLSSLLTDKASKAFLETYDMAVKRRMPEDSALLFAAQQSAMPENLKAKQMIPHADADKLVRRTLRDLGVDERGPNYQIVEERVADMSKHGATEAEIKRALEDDILDTAVPINGMLVFDHRDLPADFPELMLAELQKRAKAEGIEDPEDLYVAADGAEARWYVMSKSRRMPLSAVPITPQILEGHRSERRATHDAEIRALARSNDAERAVRKKRYEEGIAKERERIAHWRGLSSRAGGLRKTYADSVADDLQRSLDERLASDAEALRVTPAQRAEEREQELKRQARENAKSLGFSGELVRE